MLASAWLLAGEVGGVLPGVPREALGRKLHPTGSGGRLGDGLGPLEEALGRLHLLLELLAALE